MENNIVKVYPSEEAVLLHSEILAKGRVVGSALADFCDALKRMRDSSLFRDFGYEEFGDYCEDKLGIKKRQAYNYIASYERLGADYITEHSALGITKLEMISRLSPADREEVEKEAPDMSASELKRVTEELSLSGRQIELLNEELGEKDSKIDELTHSITDMENELSDLRDELADAKERAEDAAKAAEREKAELEEALRTDIEKKTKAELEKKFKKSVKEASKEEVEKARADAAKEADAKSVEALKVAEAAKERIASLEAEKEAADERVKQLEKALKSADANVAACKVHFNAIKDHFEKMMECVEKADGEMKQKLKDAAFKLINSCLDMM